MFYKQVENYNNKSYFFSHVKSFWVIQNKDTVIKTLKRLSDRNQAKTIATYDFSTLYTKIPHSKLKNVLHEITKFCFKGCSESRVLISSNGARCSRNQKTDKEGQILLSEKQVKEMIYF